VVVTLDDEAQNRPVSLVHRVVRERRLAVTAGAI
jgi:hypothetical protein